MRREEAVCECVTVCVCYCVCPLVRLPAETGRFIGEESRENDVSSRIPVNLHSVHFLLIIVKS